MSLVSFATTSAVPAQGPDHRARPTTAPKEVGGGPEPVHRPTPASRSARAGGPTDVAGADAGAFAAALDAAEQTAQRVGTAAEEASTARACEAFEAGAAQEPEAAAVDVTAAVESPSPPPAAVPASWVMLALELRAASVSGPSDEGDDARADRLSLASDGSVGVASSAPPAAAAAPLYVSPDAGMASAHNPAPIPDAPALAIVGLDAQLHAAAPPTWVASADTQPGSRDVPGTRSMAVYAAPEAVGTAAPVAAALPDGVTTGGDHAAASAFQEPDGEAPPRVPPVGTPPGPADPALAPWRAGGAASAFREGQDVRDDLQTRAGGDTPTPLAGAATDGERSAVLAGTGANSRRSAVLAGTRTGGEMSRVLAGTRAGDAAVTLLASTGQVSRPASGARHSADSDSDAAQAALAAVGAMSDGAAASPAGAPPPAAADAWQRVVSPMPGAGREPDGGGLVPGGVAPASLLPGPSTPLAQPAAVAFPHASLPPEVGEQVAAQIISSLRMQWKDGIGEAKLQLRPDALGTVTIALRVEHGAVTAVVRAESPQVQEWVLQHQHTLRQQLEAASLHLQDLTVSPDDRGQRHAHDGPPEQRRRHPGRGQQAPEPGVRFEQFL